MEGASYRVLDINNSSNTLTVVRADYWDNNCPAKKVNTTLNSTLFSYNTSYPEVTIFYECSVLVSSPNQFNCTGDTISYYVTGSSSLFTSTGSSILTCNENVRVPISQSAESAIETRGYTAALLTEALKGGFGLEWNASNEECKGCVRSDGQCGSNSNQFARYCENGTSASTCLTATSFLLPAGEPVVIDGNILIGVVGILLILAILFGFRRKWSSGTKFSLKRKSKVDKKVEEFLRRHGSLAPKRFSYWEIKKMTNSFTFELGQGGYGRVYKEKLSNDRLVAVKVLSELKGNGEEFMNEIASISRTSHVNIVMLIGFCYEGARRALIYEYMPNGSLDKFISDSDSHIEWETLYRIAVGIGRGLEYLHQGCNTRILHFDIKPHNILLDDDFCPKISDFGLSKLCQRAESMVSMTNARGTIGYIAPEVFFKNFGGVTHKSDVYSYGMLVLDLVGGRQNREATHTSDKYFPDWIYKHLKNINGDDLILGRVVRSEEEETVRKIILVSLWCIQTNPKERPSIQKVLEMLEGSLQAIETPPKPFLCSPPSSPRQLSTTSLSVPSM